MTKTPFTRKCNRRDLRGLLKHAYFPGFRPPKCMDGGFCPARSGSEVHHRFFVDGLARKCPWLLEPGEPGVSSASS